ncbi:MAG: hypothetical protein JWO69_893 [Thermoleophilia bacterium]|jgi:hypothetical protein|nr:hypothetical protein [Thermoleophilia bacterium]
MATILPATIAEGQRVFGSIIQRAATGSPKVLATQVDQGVRVIGDYAPLLRKALEGDAALLRSGSRPAQQVEAHAKQALRELEEAEAGRPSLESRAPAPPRAARPAEPRSAYDIAHEASAREAKEAFMRAAANGFAPTRTTTPAASSFREKLIDASPYAFGVITFGGMGAIVGVGLLRHRDE